MSPSASSHMQQTSGDCPSVTCSLLVIVPVSWVCGGAALVWGHRLLRSLWLTSVPRVSGCTAKSTKWERHMQSSSEKKQLHYSQKIGHIWTICHTCVDKLILKIQLNNHYRATFQSLISCTLGVGYFIFYFFNPHLFSLLEAASRGRNISASSSDSSD